MQQENIGLKVLHQIGGEESISREKAADLLNIGTTSVDRARAVLKRGTPDQIKSVELEAAKLLNYSKAGV